MPLIGQENRILEMIARGEPLTAILEALVLLVEANQPDGICSILLLDEDGQRLRHGAAPNLPQAYNRFVDGLEIGPNAGSCGTAAYRKEPVIVADIAIDPRWAAYREFALAHGLHACWSTPILARNGDVLGTFALYHRFPHHTARTELTGIKTATYLAGVALERVRREEALRASEARYRSLLNLSPDAILVHQDFRFVYANEVAMKLLEASDICELQSLSVLKIIPLEARDHEETRIQYLYDGGGIPAQEQRWVTLKGQQVEVEVSSGSCIWKGHPAAQIVARDISALKRMNQQLQLRLSQIEAQNLRLERQKEELAEVNKLLQELAITDSLTGVFNHRALQERLREEFDRSRRYGAPLSILMIDVDRFKQYNDTFGHPAGDVVLREVASILRRNGRISDIVARYGGEEFAVLLPQTDATTAHIVATRLRTEIERATWPGHSITVSIGISTMQPTTTDAPTLLSEADNALYGAKQAGRNCVVHATT